MLNLKNLSFEIGSKTILDQINYVFLPNKIYVITGENGSGKSTLARLIMGLAKHEQGTIFLGENNLDQQNITQRAKLGISLSFQQPIRFKGVTVRDLLSLSTGKFIDDLIGDKLLDDVGLGTAYLDRNVNEKLSGGELKRIELATTLARQPRVAIFDEPEAGIDLWSFDSLIKIFRNLRSKNRIIIIISHQKKILELADKILLLKNGQITEYSSYKNLFQISRQKNE